MTSEKHETIRYTADVVLLCDDTEGLDVLLIRRGRDPYVGKWALPGGRVERGETARQAAVRELHEEAGIVVDADDLTPVGIYDDPDRDPRGRYVSVAFIVAVDRVEPVAGDDADLAQWHPLASLPPELAFDHHVILDDARKLADSIVGVMEHEQH